jgi:hypothetical protein
MSSLDEKIGGALDIVGKDWGGLPWNTDPRTAKGSDFRPVVSGTYFLAKIEDGWVYIKQGDREYKLEEGDVRARWPRL